SGPRRVDADGRLAPHRRGRRPPHQGGEGSPLDESPYAQDRPTWMSCVAAVLNRTTSRAQPPGRTIRWAPPDSSSSNIRLPTPPSSPPSSSSSASDASP